MTITQINADVLDWVKQYKGEKFHALLSDPPYHLAPINKRFGKPDSAPAKYGRDGAFQRASRGFMGQSWDGGDIAFNSEMWHALGELLYPGAFMFIYAGTRTYHRVAVAVEDAGFVIHPAIGWVTCLSEDTEILTESGWVSYDRLSVGSKVMCYNLSDKSFDYMPATEVVSYDYDDTVYNIKSDSTDQIVTPNHRVIVERRGRQVFRYASTLQRQENVPILDGLWKVREIIYGQERERVLGEDNLWVREVQKEPHSQASTSQTQRDNSGLSGLRENGLQKIVGTEENLIFIDMLEAMQRFFESHRDSGEVQKRDAQGEVSVRERAQETERTLERGEKSIVEGWSSLLSQAQQLCSSKIRALSTRIFSNGAKGWVCDGAQIVSGAVVEAPAIKRRGCTSYQPRPARQSSREPDVVLEQFLSQEFREQWIPTTTLATVTPIHYKGKVWCVTVPTGAFVARRNGHVFITGNSQGFPKATRIDTQIDRKAGVQRERVGEAKTGVASGTHRHTGIDGAWGFDDEYYETAPSTPLAQAWAGHRYGLMALKPAFEFILCAQRPYEGKPVDNITETGAGALNIDAGRVGNIGGGVDCDNRDAYGKCLGHGNAGRCTEGETVHGPAPLTSQGRWPSNVVLSHLPECVKIGEREESYPINRFTDGAKPFGDGAGHEFETEVQTTIVSIYRCAPGCPVSTLNSQSVKWNEQDLSGVFYTVPPNETEDVAMYVPKVTPSERDAGLDHLKTVPYAQSGGATKAIERGEEEYEHDEFIGINKIKKVKNNHPTLKPIELNRWLAKLLLPPDMYKPRRILVPFAGVLSEAIGAELAGWEEVTAVELTPEYIPIGKARAEYWTSMRSSGADARKLGKTQLSFDELLNGEKE